MLAVSTMAARFHTGRLTALHVSVFLRGLRSERALPRGQGGDVQAVPRRKTSSPQNGRELPLPFTECGGQSPYPGMAVVLGIYSRDPT